MIRREQDSQRLKINRDGRRKPIEPSLFRDGKDNLSPQNGRFVQARRYMTRDNLFWVKRRTNGAP